MKRFKHQEASPIEFPLNNRFHGLEDEMCGGNSNTKDESGNADSGVDLQSNVDKHNCQQPSGSILSESNGSSRTVVNLSCLQPAELMTLQVLIGGKHAHALVDSGSTKNLIRQSAFLSSDVQMLIDNTIIINGLGGSRIMSLGTAYIDVGCLDKTINLPVVVVPDYSIQYDVILGIEFFNRESMSIDMSRRRLGRLGCNGSMTYFYFDKDHKLSNVIYESIPVYAADNIKLTKSGTRVPLQINTSLFDGSSKEFYFEGNAKHDMNCIDGVIDICKDETFVVVCSAVRENKYIRKGQQLGNISTMIDLTGEVDDEELSSHWTRDRLLNEIELGMSLENCQKVLVYDMLLRVHKVMSTNDGDIGKAKVTPQVIEVTNNSPIWQRPRRFSDPVNKEIERQCNELLSLDILENSHSNWSSPLVPIRKKCGQLRMCVDYRMLNRVTKPENFPMPNVTESIYAAHNVRYFTKLDLVRGYYQVPIDPESRKYTAFSTPHRHLQFKRLSFGLRNSGYSFQRTMQQILAEFCFHNVLIYIDDILILSESFDEHLILVEKVLTTLANYGIKIKVEKCQFFREQVEFLGHIVSRDGIRKSPDFIQKISQYPRPQTITQLRQFLGLVNFQRKFINKCSVIAKPLSELTGGPKNSQLVWTAEMIESFELLKEELLKEVTLSYPDYSSTAEKLELFVDASSVGAGACLVQYQRDQYKTIAYSSMTFTAAQRRYSTIERELVALRWGIKTFRGFLFAVPFVLYTDHKPLLYLQNMSRENSRIMRTMTELAEFDFVIKYRPGRDNEAADAMSRIVNVPVDDDSETIDDELPTGFIVPQIVEGGGNSLFESLLICLRHVKDSLNAELPNNHYELRCQLVDFILSNPAKINAKPTKEFIRRMKVMRRQSQLPCEEFFSAASIFFNVEINIHHGIRWPVIHKPSQSGDYPKVHLQCKAGIHFNPALDCNRNVSKVSPNAKYVNCVHNMDQVDFLNICPYVESELEPEISGIVTVNQACVHSQPVAGVCTVEANGIRFCALVDTGAQVSLLNRSISEIIISRCPALTILEVSNNVVTGIDGSKTMALGYLVLQLSLEDKMLECPMPLLIVNDSDIPCCAILGANFLRMNRIIVNFRDFLLHIGCESGYVVNVPLAGKLFLNDIGNSAVTVFTSACVVTSDEAELVLSSSEEETDSENIRISFLPRNTLIEQQNNDPVLSLLKHYLVENVACKLWREDSLAQFKHSSKYYRVTSDLLVRDCNGFTVPLVSFEFAVKFVFKVHKMLAHIGKHKLDYIVRRHCFHPCLCQIVADVCLTCVHCQLYKVHAQQISPPVLKIHSRFPYDLVAMDLLQFSRSSNGNVVCLVVVDHCSKFVFVVPLKDKKSLTICKALSMNIFPRMIRLPSRILTDHGGEFSSSQFEEALRVYNIKHVYATRYRPQSNGCVERVNRTIIQFLRGIVNDSQRNWDVAVHKAVIIYNNTWHSAINDTPSNYVLSRPHIIDESLPMEVDTIETWKEAHPKFESFALNQKVCLKVNKIGNRVIYKLGQKFTGPFTVTKIQTNGVSYEVSDGTGTVKAHHAQLKLWHDPPEYFERCMVENLGDEVRLDVRDSDADSSSSDDFFNFTEFSVGRHDESSAVNSDGSENIGGSLLPGSEKVQDVVKSHDLSNQINLNSSWITEDLMEEFSSLQSRLILYESFLNNENCTSDKVTRIKDLNLSFDTEDCWEEDGIDQYKVSTPMFLMNRNVVEMSVQTSSIVDNDKDNDKDNDEIQSLDNAFLLWLEQSLHAQEDFIERIVTISKSLNDAWVDDVSDVINLPNLLEESPIDERNDVLQGMFDHLHHVASGVADYRADRDGKLWKSRFVSKTCTVNSTVDEVSDILPNVSAETSPVICRMTRSRGMAQEYPNVQSRPIEHKGALKQI